MSVQRLRDELDVEESDRAETRAAAAAGASVGAASGSTRAASAAFRRPVSAVESRRGSLHELIRPAAAAAAAEGGDAADMGEPLIGAGEREHSSDRSGDDDNDGSGGARLGGVASPLPGAIDDGAEEREEARAHEARAQRDRAPSASMSRHSTSSQRRRPQAYTTTLEEDAERDAQELLARQRAEAHRIQQEDMEAEVRAQEMQQQQQREDDEAAAAAAAQPAAPAPLGASVPQLSRAPSARRQASSSRVADLSSMIEPQLRPSSAANNRDADSLPGDADGAALMDAHAAAAALEADLIAPPPRASVSSAFSSEDVPASAPAAGGRQRRKYNPSVDFSAEPHLLPSPPVELLPSVEQEQEHSGSDGEADEHTRALLHSSGSGGGAPFSDDADHAALASGGLHSESARDRAASLRLKASSAMSRSRASARGEDEEEMPAPPSRRNKSRSAFRPLDVEADSEAAEQRPLASPSGALHISEPLPSPSQAHEQDQEPEDEVEAEVDEAAAAAAAAASAEAEAAAEAAAEADRTPSTTPPPVFEHVVRKYPTIDDPLLELRRIRAYKDFEAEFDDLVLPSFSGSDLRPAGGDGGGEALQRPNPLKAAYDAVHELLDAETRAPLSALFPAGTDLPAAGDASEQDMSALLDPHLLEDVLGLGRVSLEESEALEAALEAERIEDLQAELARRHVRERELAGFAAALSAAHVEQTRARAADIAEKEHQLLQKTRLLMKEEQESFRRAEDRMRSGLLERGARLGVKMRDLQGSDADSQRELREIKEREERRVAAAAGAGDGAAGAPGGGGGADDLGGDAPTSQVSDLYAAVRSRRYEVAWNYEPRLVRLRADWIRCVKNKLPPGNYQLMVTLYDRLGGTPLRWNTAPGPGGAGAGFGSSGGVAAAHPRSNTFTPTGSTVLAQRHEGRYYNTDMCFNQKANRIFLACPPLPLSRPSMVFVFELFLCGDQAPAAAATTSAAAAAAAAAVQAKRGGVFASVASGAASVASSASVLASELMLKARDPKQYALLKAAQANAAAKALQRAPPSSDRVVAWGAFPMSYINFDIIRGAFKVPLLRGKYGPDAEGGPVEKFETIHERIAGDLDAWLANLYFDVRPWPRLVDNAVENTVALDFTGARKPGEDESSDDEQDEEEVLIGEDGAFAVAGDGTATQTAGGRRTLAASGSAAAAAAAAHAELGLEMMSMRSMPPDILVLDGEGSADADVDARDRSTSPRAHARRNSAADEPDEAHRIDFMGGSAGAGTPLGSVSGPKAHRKANSSMGGGGGGGGGAISKRKGGSGNGGPKARHEAVTSTERRIRIKLHSKRFPGMLRDIPEGGATAGEEWMDAEMRDPRRRAHLCKSYKYNVDLPSGEEEGVAAAGAAAASGGGAGGGDNPLGRKAAYKLRYIGNELWSDLGISRDRNHALSMAGTILLFLALLWARVYSHHLGQYLFLSSVRVPITRWECGWYTCTLNYISDPKSVTAQTEMGVVAMGVVTNLAVTALLMLSLAGAHRVLGRTPPWMSRVVLAWGGGTVLEPLLILLIDASQGSWTRGDSFKLYRYYLLKDGNGVAGIFMTILIYLLLIVVSVVCFYNYVIKLHMNGRILDVHYRLHGGAEAFCVPHDLEVSVRELRWILLKARRWVGLGGQKRKVQVSKFLVRDPLRRAGPRAADLSIYIAIYTQSLTGDVELFRHFIRAPCGRICEIFDSFDIPGEEGFKKIEEKLTSHERRLQALQALAGEAFSKAGAGGAGAGGAGKSDPMLSKARSLLRTSVNVGAGSSGGGGGGSGGPGTPSSGALVGKARFKSLTLGARQSSLGQSSFNKVSELNR